MLERIEMMDKGITEDVVTTAAAARNEKAPVMARLKRWLLGVYAVCLCTISCHLTTFAAVSNPVENARGLATDWLKSCVYIALGVFGVILFVKKRFTELFTFAVIAIIAIALIFYPENMVNFFGSIVTVLFPG